MLTGFKQIAMKNLTIIFLLLAVYGNAQTVFPTQIADGGSPIKLGSDGTNQQVWAGTGGGNKTVYVGSIASGSTTFIQSGTGNILLNNSPNKVGVNTFTPTSTFHVEGSISLPFTSTSTSLTVTTAMYTINCNNAAANITITLPTPVGITGRIYVVKRDQASTGTVSITPTAGNIQALAGTFGSTTSLAALGGYGQSATFQSDGINWHRIQ